MRFCVLVSDWVVCWVCVFYLCVFFCVYVSLNVFAHGIVFLARRCSRVARTFLRFVRLLDAVGQKKTMEAQQELVACR